MKTSSRIAALFFWVIVMSLGLSQSGRTASTCLVERGIDPLDVLNQQAIRHNVWIALDTSGSMDRGIANDNDPPTRIDTARDTIIELLDHADLVDSLGNPKFNWGFTFYDQEGPFDFGDPGFDGRAGIHTNTDNDVTDAGESFILEWKCPTSATTSPLPPGGEPPADDGDDDSFPEQPTWCKGMDATRIDAPSCGDPDPRNLIKNHVNKLADDLNCDDAPNTFDNSCPAHNADGTPNGVMLDEISEFLGTQLLEPGQKNFIVLLTDGEDTCECYDYMYDDPLKSNATTFDGTLRLRGTSATSAPTHAFSSNSSGLRSSDFGQSHELDVSAYNAGLKAEVAFQRIDDIDGDGTSGDGRIFVVGMVDSGTPQAVRVNHLGWEASGLVRPAFFASDPVALRQALLDVFSLIDGPTATVSAGMSVVGSVKEVIASHTNTTHDLNGADLLASGVGDTAVRNLRAAHRNNVLFTSSFELPGFRGHFRAHNIYTVAEDESRTADFTEIWDAGDELQERDLLNDPRRIYFNRSDGTGGQLGTTIGATTLSATDLGVSAGFLDDLDPTGVGAKTATDAVEIVEKVLQGWRLVIDPTDGFYTSTAPGAPLNFSQFESDGITKTWKLWDATNSAPAVVLNPPRSPDVDPPVPTSQYSEFYGDNINRMTVVYLGTNGGMMQAFRADNGFEVYGYIPHDLLPELPSFVRTLVTGNNGITGHGFFVAASATVQDAFLQDSPNGIAEWRTVLGFGRGAGGKYVTALDVTDVGDWNGDDPFSIPAGFQPPQLLFTVGNRDGVADLDVNGADYDGFGETWSLPVMGRVHNGTAEGQWVLFMGTGYGCVGTDEGRYLYALALEDGTVYFKSPQIADVVNAGEPGIDQNGTPATPTLFNPHEPGINDGRDFVTRVYIGDLQGVIHKLDATADDPGDWQFGPFFEVTDEADQAEGQGDHNQPITVRIEALKLVGDPTILLFVGTGGDSRVQLTDPESFKMVGIVDTDSSSTIPATDPGFPGTLLTLENGIDKFFINLPEGERVVVPPVLARNTSTNGVVFFTTVRPEFNPANCSTTFTSTLFAAGVNSGLGTFDLDPTLSGIQGQVDLGAGKVTSLFHRDEHLYVSKSGGLETNSGTEVLGSEEFPAPIVGSGSLQMFVDGFRMSPF
ncbi:MAG: pilus assembly protein [Vicinamibacteria bacterium]